MKKIFFLFFLFLFNFNSVSAEEKILFLDINLLLNESDVGKYLNKELKKINDKNIEDFKKIEKSIKEDDENLAKQKNILNEDELNSKINELKKKYASYNKLKNSKSIKLNETRDNAIKEILLVVNGILAEYSKENNISLIIDKKNLVIGKTQLDVTNEILKLLNKKISEIKL